MFAWRKAEMRYRVKKEKKWEIKFLKHNKQCNIFPGTEEFKAAKQMANLWSLIMEMNIALSTLTLKLIKAKTFAQIL